MPRDAVSRTANVGTVGINGLKNFAPLSRGFFLQSLPVFFQSPGLWKTVTELELGVNYLTDTAVSAFLAGLIL